MPDTPLDKSSDIEARSDPKSVLFLCNHNVIRSPMAERLMRNDYGLSYYVQSAGVRIGNPDPFVVAIMAERGINIADHVPKALDELVDSWFDLIVTFSPTAHHIALEMEHVEAAEVLYWPAADPTVVQGSRDRMMDAYREVRNSIQEQLVKRFGPPNI